MELLVNTVTLRKLTLSDMPLSYGFFKTLDDALKKKRATATKTDSEKGEEGTKQEMLPLRDLNLSESKLDDKSVKCLTDTLKLLGKTMASVDLANSGLQPDGIHLICEALLFCTGVNLKHLDFSENVFDKDSTGSLSPVLAAGTCLEYLGLRNCTGLDISGAHRCSSMRSSNRFTST